MKKVLAILGILVLVAGCGLGVFGTLKFRKDYNTQLQQNASLVQQNSQVQAQIDAIGAMGVAYQVVTPRLSGQLINEADLKEVSVPVSINGDSSVTSKEDLIGRRYRCNVTTGTLITKDLLMEEGDFLPSKFDRELVLPSLPVKLEVGDYVDLKFLIANGEEYVVLSRKQVNAISGTTISIKVSETENQIINSAIMDVSQFSNACILYCDRYLEPGNSSSISFYPVQDSMAEFIMFNPNVEDYTMCINTNMRAHIDEMLIMYSNSNNSANASSFISGFEQQLSAQLTMRGEYLQQKKAAEDAQTEVVPEALPETSTEVVTEESQEIDLEAIN